MGLGRERVGEEGAADCGVGEFGEGEGGGGRSGGSGGGVGGFEKGWGARGDAVMRAREGVSALGCVARGSRSGPAPAQSRMSPVGQKARKAREAIVREGRGLVRR